MAAPFHPTVAAAATGRPVAGMTKMPSLGGPASPLQKYGVGDQPNGNPHVNTGPKAFAQPMQQYTDSTKIAQTHETRGGHAGVPGATTQGINTHNTVPHINMHPIGGM